MAYFTATIPVASLRVPVGPRPPHYKYGEEADLYEAYKARLDVARALGQAQKYYDGVHYLHISSECFLKYIFCLVRHEIYVLKPPAIEDGSIPYDVATAFLFPRNQITTKDFSHNLNRIVKFLNKFSDAGTHREFNVYIRHLSSNEDWINTRYKAVPHTLYQAEFQSYLADFDALLNGCFVGAR